MVDVEALTTAVEVRIRVRLATIAPDEDPTADGAKILRHGIFREVIL
jgi:hypothetical protein